MKTKIRSLLICFLVVLAIFGAIDMSFEFLPRTSGATLYVPTNYPTIQDAINASKDGDTVFVYNGTYYENVVVNKTINLIGEDKNGTTIDGYYHGDVVRINADWVNVSGFTIINGYGTSIEDDGIDLDNVENCSVVDNNFFNNWNGFNLHNSSRNNNIIGNTLSDNRKGLFLNSSNGNNISENNLFWNHQYNIYLYSSSGNNITDNTADSSTDISIFLDTSSNNTISNNNISNNTGPMSEAGGIYLSSSPNNNISHNNILTNKYGIYLYYSSFVNIINNNISNIHNGIILSSASNNNIINNNISSHEHDGIHISMYIGEEESSNNNISNNIISNNDQGIELYKSSRNFIINNSISNNLMGIISEFSSFNRIMNNDFIKDGVFLRGNEVSHYNSHIIPTDNLVNGEPLYYYKDTDGLFVDRIPVGQLILANCTYWDIRNLQINYTDAGIEFGFCSNITLANNNVSSNDLYGIYLDFSSSNNITDNYVSSNLGGIYLRESSDRNHIINNIVLSSKRKGITLSYSQYNTISGNDISLGMEDGVYLSGSADNNFINNNNISNNEDGIQIFAQSNNNIITNNSIFNNTRGIVISSTLTPTIDNKVYHNYIIDNIVQAYDDTIFGNQWDNGYPSGGNYWSDFDEPSEGAYDDYTGPNQDVLGNDGIVDKGKGAGGGLNPYIIDADSIDLYPLWERKEYSMILKQGWNLISIPLIQVEQNLTKVLASIDGLYDAVQWYDITDTKDPWKHYRPGKPYGNDLFEINETMGFWIHIIPPGDTIFRYNGVRPTQNQSITLYPGWNLVGYPSLSNKNRTPALNNINFGSDVDSIWTYNAATQKWKEIGEFDYFELGRGYWVHAKVNKVWDVPL